MDKAPLIKPTKDADVVEPQRSKLAHPSKTPTQDENQEASACPGCKANPQTKCDSTASCAAPSDDIEDGAASGVKCKGTPPRTANETSKTNDVSEYVSDTSAAKKGAKKGKVVKKGIAQIVKKEKKKGGWKYVEESETTGAW